MTEFSIRAATADDAEVLIEFIRELAAHEGRPDVATIDPVTLNQLLYGPKALGEAFLGYVDAAPAAYLIVAERFSSFRGTRVLYIEDMLVRDAFRGAGIGKKLFVHAAAIAVLKGCDRLEWSALDDNEEALGFYQHLGAVRETGVAHFTMPQTSMRKLVESLDE